MTLIQYIFGIRSMRQKIKEIEANMTYRWFLGFGICAICPFISQCTESKKPSKTHSATYLGSLFRRSRISTPHV
jgi:transposase